MRIVRRRVLPVSAATTTFTERKLRATWSRIAPTTKVTLVRVSSSAGGVVNRPTSHADSPTVAVREARLKTVLMTGRCSTTSAAPYVGMATATTHNGSSRNSSRTRATSSRSTISWTSRSGVRTRAHTSCRAAASARTVRAAKLHHPMAGARSGVASANTTPTVTAAARHHRTVWVSGDGSTAPVPTRPSCAIAASVRSCPARSPSAARAGWGVGVRTSGHRCAQRALANLRAPDLRCAQAVDSLCRGGWRTTVTTIKTTTCWVRRCGKPLAVVVDVANWVVQPC